MDRRTSLKWVLAAAASVSLPQVRPVVAQNSASQRTAQARGARGYGTDPNLTKSYVPGELWPLSFTPPQRRAATVVCDVIIPADAHSPAASAVGVVDFIDEWISAPYPQQQHDRALILGGLSWLDTESGRRFGSDFAALLAAQSAAICDDICHAPAAQPAFREAATFFARYRDLTASGFYTTPVGRNDVKYVGNIPLASFDGPPLAVLQKVGLA